jgi:hypothetical protein
VEITRACLEDKDQLTAALKEVGSVRQLSLKLEYRSHDPVTRALARFGIDARAITGNTGRRIIYADRKPLPTEADLDTYYQTLRIMQKNLRQLDNRQTHAKIRLDETRPVGIAHWGDWHEGAVGTDYDNLDRETELLANADGVYVIGMGDYKDNFTPAGPHPTGMTEQIAQPGIQDLMVIRRVRRLMGKWLALIRGCHDHWDKRMDRDFIQTLTGPEIGDCVNLWHGGRLDIELGDQLYQWAVGHKYIFESSLNTTNSQRRLNEFEGIVDVVGTAHKHFGDVQERPTARGRTTIFLRSGSNKILDEHGQQIGRYSGNPCVPLVVIEPGQHKATPFRDLESGLRYLEAVRG